MSDDKTRVLTHEELARLEGGGGLPPADDGRTRVLSAAEIGRLVAGQPAVRPEPAAASPAPPRPTAPPDRDPSRPLPKPIFTAEKIVFYCHNGHKLDAKAADAGKRGKCSKAGCGVAVVIPVPPGAAGPVESVAEAAALPPPLQPAEVAVAASAAPSDDDPPAAASAEPAGAGDEPAETPSWDFVSGAAPDAGGSGSGLDLEPPAPGPETWQEFDVEAGDNPTARLLARLWLERDHGGVVELHMAGGSVLVPEWYEPRWSRGSHGLFASQAPDGTVTLTAVAWETIQKIVVRKVNGLPDGMF